MDSFLEPVVAVALSLVVVFVVVALVLLVLMVRKFRRVHRRDTPVQAKVSFWFSVVYTIFPLDLLPDPVYLDDIVVLVAALIHVSVVLKKSGTPGQISV